ncbi:Hypothetical predicted protein [Podarcis lilfordi]|uniref:Uncharacterized protein n=1 Tax=Podarcis lilfordi TaxID=74358 RepID=A0AA35PID8_9SAUR|nr:Hypothetical predicted protein [Podarcis lilfordi]
MLRFFFPGQHFLQQVESAALHVTTSLPRELANLQDSVWLRVDDPGDPFWQRRGINGLEEGGGSKTHPCTCSCVTRSLFELWEVNNQAENPKVLQIFDSNSHWPCSLGGVNGSWSPSAVGGHLFSTCGLQKP